MSNPNEDEARIAFNNLHTLRWTLEVAEGFRDENPDRYVAMLKFIDDVGNFADKILKENAEQEQHYLEIMRVEVSNE